VLADLPARVCPNESVHSTRLVALYWGVKLACCCVSQGSLHTTALLGFTVLVLLADCSASIHRDSVAALRYSVYIVVLD
jgi:hypothetical protein